MRLKLVRHRYKSEHLIQGTWWLKPSFSFIIIYRMYPKLRSHTSCHRTREVVAYLTAVAVTFFFFKLFPNPNPETRKRIFTVTAVPAGRTSSFSSRLFQCRNVVWPVINFPCKNNIYKTSITECV